MNIALTKQALRREFQDIRKKLSVKRRNEAEKGGLKKAEMLCGLYPSILSYASFSNEFDTWHLNRFFASLGKLMLPKTESGNLKIFHVEDPGTQLEKNSWGILEPVPEKCREAQLSDISCVLVPGLGFDKEHNRLGYGKGLYDRFLRSLEAKVPTYGLGFQEQFASNLLPRHHTDVLLSELLLF